MADRAVGLKAEADALDTRRTCEGIPLDWDPQGMPIWEMAHLQNAFEGLATRLESRTDVRGLAVQLLFGGFPITPSPLASLFSRGSEESAAAERREALVAAAERSADPAVYAMAYQVCAGRAASAVAPSCAHLSAAEWARREPGNAAPWQHEAARAAAAGDMARVAEAMHQIAQSKRVDDHRADMLDEITRSLPEGTPPEAEAMVFASAVGLLAAFADSGPMVMMKFCSVDAVADANRRETCSGVASTLIDRGSSTMDLSFGLSIAKRAGWPAVRVAPHVAEFDAIMRMAGEPSGNDLISCAGATRAVAYFRRWGQVGELAALRERLRRKAKAPLPASSPAAALSISPQR